VASVYFGPNILNVAGDSVTIEHLYEIAPSVSNSQVTGGINMPGADYREYGWRDTLLMSRSSRYI